MGCAESFVALSVLCLVGVGVSLPSVCIYCPGKVHADGEKRCLENGGIVQERCCLDSENETVIGLDLSGCNITTLAGNVGIFQEINSSVNWIDLSDTSNEDFIGAPFSVHNVPEAFLAFQNLSNLTTVVMSANGNRSCPGPENAWQNVSYSSDSSKLVCETPVSSCSASGAKVYFRNNSACTSRAVCLDNGPGFRRCECKDGHYGYRCLRKGTFPVLPFTISVGVIVVTSFILSRVFNCRKNKQMLGLNNST